MSSTGVDQDKLLLALDKLLAKYFNVKEPHPEKDRTAKDVFWETYLDAARDEDEAVLKQRSKHHEFHLQIAEIHGGAIV